MKWGFSAQTWWCTKTKQNFLITALAFRASGFVAPERVQGLFE